MIFDAPAASQAEAWRTAHHPARRHVPTSRGPL